MTRLRRRSCIPVYDTTRCRFFLRRGRAAAGAIYGADGERVHWQAGKIPIRSKGKIRYGGKGKKSGRAPAVGSHLPTPIALRLRLGNPAALRAVHLPLLQSRSDGVRRHLPRRDRILITIGRISVGSTRNLGREFSLASRAFPVQRSPGSPPSATSNSVYPIRPPKSNALGLGEWLPARMDNQGKSRNWLQPLE